MGKMVVKPSARFLRFMIRKWIFRAPNWAILAYAEIIGVRRNIEAWLNRQY